MLKKRRRRRRKLKRTRPANTKDEKREHIDRKSHCDQDHREGIMKIFQMQGERK